MKLKSLIQHVAILISTVLAMLPGNNFNILAGDNRQVSSYARTEHRYSEGHAANLVSVPFAVYQVGDGKAVTNLKKENVAVFLDGIQKDIVDFSTPDRPLAVALLVEYSKLGTSLGDNKSLGFGAASLAVVEPAGNLLTQLITSPNDYASVVAFDVRPTPMTDLTNDTQRIVDAINLLMRNSPALRETALFDSLRFILLGGRGDAAVLDKPKKAQSDHDGLVTVQGKRRAIILVASGLDTFSKTKYAQLRKISQDAGIPILVIGTVGIYVAAMGNRLSRTEQDRLKQAEAQLNTLAVESGGALYPYAAEGDLPKLFERINAMIRAQYNLSFNPGDTTDGQPHKIVVKVDANGDGVYDEKTLVIQARQIYNAATK